MQEKLFTYRLTKELTQKLAAVQVKDLNTNKFNLFRRNYPWLSKELNQQFDSFYGETLLQKSIEIPLTVNIKNEIELFFWAQANQIDALLWNYNEFEKKLFEFHSPMRSHLAYFYNYFTKGKVDLQFVFNTFIEKWESLLMQRIVNYKLSEIQYLRQYYLSNWSNKILIVNKFRNLVGYAWDFFGRFWESDARDFKNINLNTLVAYGRVLESNPAIMEIARMLGRLKGISTIIEEHIHERKVIDYVLQPISNWPEEIVGVTQGSNLEHLLPLELVNIAVPELQAIFYKRFIENKLSITEFESMDYIATEVIRPEIVRVPIPESEGPFIICVDTSKSMHNAPEIIAKAMTLAIVKTALREKRNCYMINFSSQLEVYDLSEVKNSVESLMDFLAKSFHSQTNITPALNIATQVMQERKYKNADLLIISDFISSNVSDTLYETIQQLQQDRNRFHAMVIGKNPLQASVTQIFDNCWHYDPADPLAANRILEDLQRKWLVNKRK